MTAMEPMEAPKPPRQSSGLTVVVLSVVAGVCSGIVGCVAVLLFAWPHLESLGQQGTSSPVASASNTGAATGSETTLKVEGGDTSAIKAAIDKAMPAVVHVTQFGGANVPAPYQGRDLSSGSGFIFDGKRGLVVTNAHVVGGLTDVYVKLASATDDSDRVPARRLAVDPYHDLAVLKIGAEQELPQVTFGDSDSLAVGDWVLALGGPFGLDRTATLGIVSAKHRKLEMSDPFDPTKNPTRTKAYEDLVQTDAAINQGNSGGPLVNLNGDVIGINSVIQSPTGTSAGVGFAIASNVAKKYVDQMMSTGYLGVSLSDYEPQLGGPPPPEGHVSEVADVLPNSPADKAGLKKGDFVLSVDGKDMPGTEQVVGEVSSHDPGQKITVEVFRPSDNKTVKLPAVVGDRRDY